MSFKKFDYAKIIETRQKNAKKGELVTLCTADEMPVLSSSPADFVVMPDWFKVAYGVIGLPHGRVVQWAGQSDSGKSSIALLAMKMAQDQGIGVAYMETEAKTTGDDMKKWGVEPSGVIMDHAVLTEDAWEKSFAMIDSFFETYPGERLLFIFDSYGNTTSLHDENLDLMKDHQKPGGHAKTNRAALGKLKAKMSKNLISVLIINYNYANMGSVGRTNAGGEALGFHSSLIVQSSRKAWIERTKGGQKVRVGAMMNWQTTKNHLVKGGIDAEGNFLPKDVEISITADGIKLGKSDAEE